MYILNEMRSDIGSKISDELKLRGWTSLTLARKVNQLTGHTYTKSVISDWLNNKGSHRINIDDLAALAEIFDRSIDYFCGMPEKPRDSEKARNYTRTDFKNVEYLHSLNPRQREIMKLLLTPDSGLSDTINAIVEAERVVNDLENNVDETIQKYAIAKQKALSTGDYTIAQNIRVSISTAFDLLQIKRQTAIQEATNLAAALVKRVPVFQSTKYPDPQKAKHTILDDEIQTALDSF